MEVENLEILKCGICGVEFLTNSKLEKHIKSEHFNEENSTLQCNKCKVQKSNYNLLVKHKKIKHKVKKSIKSKTVNKIRTDAEENCKFCERVIEKSKIYEHYKEKHGGLPVKIGGNELIGLKIVRFA